MLIPILQTEKLRLSHLPKATHQNLNPDSLTQSQPSAPPQHCGGEVGRMKEVSRRRGSASQLEGEQPEQGLVWEVMGQLGTLRRAAGVTQAGGAESQGQEDGRAVLRGSGTGVLTESLARDSPGRGVPNTPGCGAEATAVVWV